MFRLLLMIYFFGIALWSESERAQIGERAYISVVDEGIEFLARIDTGAGVSSLHAINIELEGDKAFIYVKKSESLSPLICNEKFKNEEYSRNIGRMISFDTLNEKGEHKHIKAPVSNVSIVRNAQGSEYRYVIRLGLKYQNVIKYKEVNLRDRSSMSYKLLVGRNWLNDDFVIKTDMDVEKISR